MSYLKSDFITLSGPTSLKPKTSGFFYEGSVDLPDQASLKSQKPCLYNLKDFKQDGRQQGPSKTPPLILFVNLLMKDGKKSNALRVLSMTLSLFKTRISKIKLEKHTASLKEPRNFYQYFFYPFRDPWEKAKKNIFSNYSIKAHNCYVVFSRKSHIHINRRISKTLPFSFSLFPWFSKYRKVFPFISNFCFFFDHFYTRKRFFCGKFRNLKQFTIIKKNKNQDQENHRLFSLLVENVKTRETEKPIILIKKPVLLQNTSLGRGDVTDIVSKGWLGQISFIANTFRFKQFLGPKSYSWTKVQIKNKSIVLDSQKCLWYKTLAKKPSWDSLTSAQKNSFLFCLYKAISNVKPPLECRTKRIGGSNKQIPSQVSEHRQWGIAIRWIIEVAQNEFSKRKNKSLEHKELFKPHLSHSIDNSGNVQDNSPFSREDKNYLRSATVKENKNKSFISSLLSRRPKAGPLKDHSPKTKFYYFCFFLAESLENAYYKRGPAMQKRNLWVETALANRAFLRYRWW